MNRIIVSVTGVILLFAAAFAFAEEKVAVEPNDDTVAAVDSVESPGSDQIVVYYLHMNRRCMTCNKLEAYSKEAVETGFADQLKDSSIVFQVENFEQEGNEHFAKDYQLYSQSLILSRQHNGKETEWKNLDQIWKLVGDKDEFIAYVQTELQDFVNPEEDE